MNFMQVYSEKEVLKGPDKKFQVVTKCSPKNKIKDFNIYENAYSYYKKLPKYVQKESDIWFG